MQLGGSWIQTSDLWLPDDLRYLLSHPIIDNKEISATQGSLFPLKCLNNDCSARKYTHSAQRLNPNDSGELLTIPPLSPSGQDLVLYNKILLSEGHKTNIPDHHVGSAQCQTLAWSLRETLTWLCKRKTNWRKGLKDVIMTDNIHTVSLNSAPWLNKYLVTSQFILLNFHFYTPV